MIKAGNKYHWFLAIVLTCTSLWTNGQIKFFDYFGVKEGLHASQVISIIKDSTGYLWLGTENGLYRYDGHVFRPFYSDYFDTLTISHNYISKLERDKHNRLWLGSIHSIDIMNPEGFDVRRVTSGKKSEPRQITQFVYESDIDRMWILAKNGIFYNEGKELSIKEYVLDELRPSHSNKMVIDKNGILWIIQDANVYRHDRYSCEVKKLVLPDYVKINTLGDALLCGYNQNDSVLWLGSWIHGLIALDMRTETFKSFRKYPEKRYEIAIRSIYPDPWNKHLLWLASSEGVLTFDTKTEIFKNYNTGYLYDAHGIVGEGFCFKYAPPEGLWIGTWNGLYRYDPNKNFLLSKEIRFNEEISNIVPNKIVFEHTSGINDSIVWIGTPYGSFLRYDLVNESLVNIPDFLTKYHDWDMVLSDIHLDSKNRFWMASLKFSVVIADLTKNQLINTNTQEFKKTLFFSIREGANNKIWMGSNNGLFYSEGTEEIIIQQDSFINDFLTKNGYSLYTERLNVSNDGSEILLSVLHKEKIEWRALFYLPDQKKITILTPDKYPILHQVKDINNIYKLSKNKYLATTFNEGVIIIKNIGDDYHLEHRNRIKNYRISGMAKAVVDVEGNMLITTDFGVLYFDNEMDDLLPIFPINSNLEERSFKSLNGIAFSEKSKTFYIGGNNNLTVYNPEKLPRLNNKRIYLSEVKINEAEFKNDLFLNKALNLKYHENNLKFSFTNLQFTNSDLHIYNYTLKESNDVIYQVASDHQINFTNLSPGKYSLHIESSNYFGNVSEEPLLIFFRIHPPFWQTYWFYAVILGLITTLMYSFFKYKDSQRIKLLMLRNNIAKDLHDDMGGTLSYIKILSASEAIKDKDSAYQKINIKTDEVISNMAEIIWSINPKNDALDIIISRIREFAVENLEPLNVELYFNKSEIPHNLKLNPQTRRNYYLIMKEVIHNIAKHSQATKVWVSTKMVSKNMITTIKDNGIGFEAKESNNGNGIRNIQDRALAMEAKLTIHSSPGEGTDIILDMKIL